MSELTSTLSEREIEILRLVATGASNNQIAAELSISPNTVKVHLRNIFSKLGVESRTEATSLAIREGIVVLHPVEALLPGISPVNPSADRELETLSEPMMDMVLAPDEPTQLAGPVAPRIVPLESPQSIAAVTTDRPRSLPNTQPVALPARYRWYLAVIIALVSLGTVLTWPRAQAACRSTLTECQPTVTPSVNGPSRWSQRAALSIPRSRLALAALNSKLFAIGGHTDTGPTGAVEIYSPERNEWFSGADKPTAVENIAAAVISDTVVIPGGLTADLQPTSTVEVYDPASNTWNTLAPMPGPLSAYATAVVAGRVYVLGGQNGRQFTGQTYIYDPARDEWTTGAPMPTPRGFGAAAALDGRIYMVGGYDGEREYNTCEWYDPAADRWGRCAPMQQARGGIGAVTILKRLYVLGGGWTDYLSFNERYDPQTDTWSRFETPVSLQWRNVGVAALDGDIFVVGGVSGEPLSLVKSYQAIYRLYLPATQQK